MNSDEHKNILVTGGCGFIGSNFINYINSKYPNYNIICIDNMYYSASILNINEHIRNSPKFHLYCGDINNINLISEILSTNKITDIIHFAAQSHVDSSFYDSLQYTKDNVMGTHTLLEIIRQKYPHIKFLHFSTDEVYGETKNDTAFTESSILTPTNPYAATKAAAEMLVTSYKYSFSLNTIIIRCNNVYGPSQYPEKLIPRFIKLLKNNQKLTVHGNGNYLRSFIHVDDVNRAVDIILHKGIIGETYNIHSDEEYKVLDIASILIKYMKPEEKLEDWLVFVQDRPFNDKRYLLNGDKLKNLGWKSQENFLDRIKDLF